MPACKFCGEPFTTGANVQKHQSQAPACLKKVEEEFRDISRLRRERRANASRPPFEACGNTDFGPTFEAELELQLPAENTLLQDRAHSELVVNWEATAPTYMVEVETQDEDAYKRKKVKRTAFPIKDNLMPGHAYQLGKTVFQTIRDDQILKHGEVLGPFKDDAEWELAKWLIKNAGHAQMDTFLKLSIVSQSHIILCSIPN
jgi:hypothetical protein